MTFWPANRAAFLACACLTTGALAAETSADSRVYDRAVALVEGRVLTQSELEFEARVALVQRGGVAAVTAELDAETLRNALDFAIGQRLQVFEAEKLRALPVDAKDVEAAVRAFR